MFRNKILRSFILALFLQSPGILAEEPCNQALNNGKEMSFWQKNLMQLEAKLFSYSSTKALDNNLPVKSFADGANFSFSSEGYFEIKTNFNATSPMDITKPLPAKQPQKQYSHYYSSKENDFLSFELSTEKFSGNLHLSALTLQYLQRKGCSLKNATLMVSQTKPVEAHTGSEYGPSNLEGNFYLTFPDCEPLQF